MRAQPPAVLPLRTAVREYDWGSPDAIPRLLGEAPTGRPVAELWIGAHPGAPSHWVDGQLDGTADPGGAGQGIALDALIAGDPVALLGAATAARFGRLPFLVKVLAPAKALSLQVHPDLEQARAGFARENAAGVPLDARERNYRDDNHKPELLCALAPTEALCGFRPVGQTLDLLAALAEPTLDPLVALLQEATDLAEPVRYLLELPPDLARQWVAAAAAAARSRLDADPDHPWCRELGWVVRLAEQSPDEIGPVVALLLNLLRLAPGEAVFLAAGRIHAYLSGFGVEILANSDNVLRCGLTTKHVDVPELLRIATFTPDEPGYAPDVVSADHTDYPVPVEDFLLSRYAVAGPLPLRSPGPTLLLCTAGALTASGVPLGRGRAAFVPAGREVVVDGEGELFRATAGPAVVGAASEAR